MHKSSYPQSCWKYPVELPFNFIKIQGEKDLQKLHLKSSCLVPLSDEDAQVQLNVVAALFSTPVKGFKF